MQIRRSIRAFSVLLLALLVLLIAGFFPTLAGAQAQAEPALANVTVEIWPEYDKPSALVIYNISLSPQVSLPSTLSVRIPAAAGRPYAMAWQSPDKALYDLKYDFTTSGEWSTVKFSTPAPDIRLEYYDPSLKKTGAQRDFTFRWPADYRAENLTLQIQQPANASNMKIVPDAGAGSQNTNGLTYFTKEAGPVNAGTTFDLSFSYTKPDDKLTVPDQFQAAQPNQPVDGSTAGRVTLDQILPWAIGAAGALLIAVGILWYWRGGRMTAAPARSGRARHSSSRVTPAEPAAARRAATSPVPPPMEDGEGDFCHQCGKKAGPEDVFCRACGTKLR